MPQLHKHLTLAAIQTLILTDAIKFSFFMNSRNATTKAFPRPLRTSLIFLLIGIGINYVSLCLIDGFRWSYEVLAPGWALLLIIRALLCILLAILNLILIPFKSWDFFVVCLSNSIIIYPILGFIYGGVSKSSSQGDANISPTILLFFVLFIIHLIYWYSIIFNGDIENYDTGIKHFSDYVLNSDILIFILGGGFLAWLLSTIKPPDK